MALSDFAYYWPNNRLLDWGGCATGGGVNRVLFAAVTPPCWNKFWGGGAAAADEVYSTEAGGNEGFVNAEGRVVGAEGWIGVGSRLRSYSKLRTLVTAFNCFLSYLAGSYKDFIYLDLTKINLTSFWLSHNSEDYLYHLH